MHIYTLVCVECTSTKLYIYIAYCICIGPVHITCIICKYSESHGQFNAVQPCQVEWDMFLDRDIPHSRLQYSSGAKHCVHNVYM